MFAWEGANIDTQLQHVNSGLDYVNVTIIDSCDTSVFFLLFQKPDKKKTTAHKLFRRMTQVFKMPETLQRAQRENFQYFATTFGLFRLSGALKTHSRTACSQGYLEKFHQHFTKKIPGFKKKSQVLGIPQTWEIKKIPRFKPGIKNTGIVYEPSH